MANVLAFPGFMRAKAATTMASSGHQNAAALSENADGTLVLSPAIGLEELFSSDWSNQELADLYRVESLLIQAKVRISTGRGLSDEGDPWFVFQNDDGDVFLHLARVDNMYILASPSVDTVLQGSTFSALIERFFQITASKAPTSSNIVALNPHLCPSSVVRLHPAVIFAALVWSLYLASSKFAGVAHAAEGPNHDSSNIPQTDNVPLTLKETLQESDTHMALTHLARIADKTVTESYAKQGVLLAPRLATGTGEMLSETRGSLAGPTAGVASQSIAASLTVIAVSYGFYTPPKDDTLSRETTGFHVPPVALDVEKPSADELHFKEYSTDVRAESIIHTSFKTHATAPGGEIDLPTKVPTDLRAESVKQFYHTSLLSSDNIDLEKYTLAVHTVASQTNKETSPSAVAFMTNLTSTQLTTSGPVEAAIITESQMLFSTIIQHVGNVSNYQIGNVTVSASMDLFDLDKLLIHLNGDFDSSIYKEDPATTAPPSLAVTADNTVLATTSQFAVYDAKAKDFVSHFIQASGGIEMVQFNSEIIIVDKDTIEDSYAHAYARSWITDDGHIISTIGHLQEFVQGGVA